MTSLTSEQFQASRAWCDDLGAVLADASWSGDPVPASGWLYLGCLYIDEVKEHWPDDAKREGKWHLLLDRDEYITDDLESLERQLYDFAISAGYGFDRDRAFTALTHEYEAWNKQQGLDLGSADEHVHDENLTPEQRQYVRAFSERWERVAHA